jgi:hypothetical protein
VSRIEGPVTWRGLLYLGPIACGILGRAAAPKVSAGQFDPPACRFTWRQAAVFQGMTGLALRDRYRVSYPDCATSHHRGHHPESASGVSTRATLVFLETGAARARFNNPDTSLLPNLQFRANWQRVNGDAFARGLRLAAHLSDGRRSFRQLIYPTDRSNRQPGACKNSQWMSTASIRATVSRGSEHTGDAPGDSVLIWSKQFHRDRW